jgi:hypothetical protein
MFSSDPLEKVEHNHNRNISRDGPPPLVLGVVHTHHSNEAITRPGLQAKERR